LTIAILPSKSEQGLLRGHNWPLSATRIQGKTGGLQAAERQSTGYPLLEKFRKNCIRRREEADACRSNPPRYLGGYAIFKDCTLL
jgi:hypothetical protein